MRRLLFALLLLVAAAVRVEAAVSPDERLADPALEARARALSRELRCLVCQNESIDDSDADLARDLRRIVREQLVAGADETRIKQYLVTRYGDFVLLSPPVRGSTALLWVGPFAILGIGAGIAALHVLRRRRREAADATHGGAGPLTAEERRELDGLLTQDPAP